MENTQTHSPQDIKTTANAVQNAIITHMKRDTEKEDEKNEIQRDIRIAAALQDLASEGKLPPRAKPSQTRSVRPT